jgi:two-component system alkaline phosphatase synthesis response regulator PhoP
MAAGTILIVDDERLVRDVLSRALRRAGFVVREAATGEDALEIARSEMPRLVLLDIALPGMSGYLVCKVLRDEFADEIAIVLLSGVRTDHLDRTAGLIIGADDYIIKPFELGELLARVRRLTARVSLFGLAASRVLEVSGTM